jgi:hypothetical protein
MKLEFEKKVQEQGRVDKRVLCCKDQCFGVVIFYYLFFFGTGIGTQGLTLASQMLCQLCHTPSPRKGF